VRGFLRHFCKQNDKPLLELAPNAMDALLTYDWPGNIRELRTAIEHGVVMATGKQITLRDLPMAVRQAAIAKLPGGVSPTEDSGDLYRSRLLPAKMFRFDLGRLLITPL